MPCVGTPRTSSVGSPRASKMRNRSQVRLQCKCYADLSDLPHEGFATATVPLGAPRFRTCQRQAEGLSSSAGEVEALHEYDAWRILREAGDAAWRWAICSRVRDGQLRICKYVGFEPAQWVLPEAKHQVRAAGRVRRARRDQRPRRPVDDARHSLWATISTIFACAASVS